ncbi:MAG TPA: prepilin-type N-terminal cleavage/methylation domain-containing protein, partial [Tepidisphaeraceae bacterium]
MLADRQDAGDSFVHRSSFIVHRSLSSFGFTLTELLVVISIIVLMLGLAVPVLKILGGSKSIESAENQIAAILGRARAQALTDRTVAGAMFFYDPKIGRVEAVIVEETPGNPYPGGPNGVSLDLATSTLPTGDCYGGTPVADTFRLPPGIGVEFVHDCLNMLAGPPPVRQGDGYIGFNVYNSYPTSPGAATYGAGGYYGVEYGGVILFDGNGKLVSNHYIFHTATNDTTGMPFTKLGQLLYGTSQYDKTLLAKMSFVSPSLSVYSQYGLVVFDHDAFISLGYSDQDPICENQGTPGIYNGNTWTDATNPSATYQSEAKEETWLDDNSTPLIIDRYNGSLIRGE